MSDLLTRYQESGVDNVVKARLQSQGDDSVAVNHFDRENVFSSNFEPYSDGSYFTEYAKNYYNQELSETDQQFTQYNRNNRYVDNNPNLPGVIRSSR